MVEKGEGLIFRASEFVFQPSPQIGRARQILIKPNACFPKPYPVTTSPWILESVISAIREVSEADIVLLEGSPDRTSMEGLYESLGYRFPRVHMLDVRDCVLVEVENPLSHPFAMSTFWLPNVVLYCDYLISISPCKVVGDQANLTVSNLISLLPVSKYHGDFDAGWGALDSLGMHKVMADLYFTLPFDLGVIDASTKLVCRDDPTQGEAEGFGQVFVGEPFEVDEQAVGMLEVGADYLQLIESARSQVLF